MTMENLFIVATYIWALTGVYWIAAAQRTKPAKKKEKLLFRVCYMILWVLPFAITFLPVLPEGFIYDRLFPSHSFIAMLAFIGMLVGLGFMIWSRVVLGNNWSGRIAIKENHQFVTSGPYKYVRNPMYAGFIIGFLFSTLLLNEVRGLVAFIILLIGILIKLHKEEKFVKEAFGKQYEEYANRVSRLIPFLY